MPSSVVAGIMYDKLSNTLRVTYVSGMIYDYKDVPEEIYTALKTSFSKGVFLSKYVKGKYEFEKIKQR
jgi:KTSC domain-containing protein